MPRARRRRPEKPNSPPTQKRQEYVPWRRSIEKDWCSAKRVPVPCYWHEAREVIEQCFKAHQQTNKHSADRQYVTGEVIRGDMRRKLTSNCKVLPGDRLVVRTEPLDAKLYAQFRANYKSPAEWAVMPEELRLAHVLNCGWRDCVFVQDYAEYLKALKTTDAVEHNPDARCSECGRSGHWAQDCSYRRAEGFVPIYRRRAPCGIPSHQLRPPTDEEMDKAYRLHDGTLVVVDALKAQAPRTSTRPHPSRQRNFD